MRDWWRAGFSRWHVAGAGALILAAALTVALMRSPALVVVDETPAGVSAEWHRLPDAPIAARTAGETFVHDDTVVMFGGWRERGDDTVYQLDGAIYLLDEDRWEPIKPAPLEPRSGPLVSFADGRLLVFGGEATTEEGWHIGGEIEVINGEEVETGSSRTDGAVYDLTTGEWTYVPPIEGDWRGTPNVVAWDGEEIVVFGNNWTGPLRSINGAIVQLDGAIVEIPEAPVTRREYEAVAWDGRQLVVWGGQKSAAAFDDEPGPALADGAVWDRGTGEWRSVAASPLQGGVSASAVAVGDRMLILAGYTGECDECPDAGTDEPDGAWYDPATDTWSPFTVDLADAGDLYWHAYYSPPGSGVLLVAEHDDWTLRAAMTTNGEVHELDLPSRGLLLSDRALVANLYSSGLTISVETSPGVWLSTSPPGSRRGYGSFTAELLNGSVFVWGGTSQSFFGTKQRDDGWILRIDGDER